MAYTYKTVDGQRVEVNVAAGLAKLAAEFHRVFGLSLLVTSGTRTRAEQQELYDGWINRRPGYNLAARPGTSNHEEDGPIGPRALDLRDSGADAGVTVKGTKRANWLKANAPRFGFDPAGYNPNWSQIEPWHYEWTGSLGGSSASSGSVSSETIASRQRFLKHDRGESALVADGIDGPATQAAVKRYQKFLGVKQDGIWGAATEAAHQASKAKSSSSSSDPFGIGRVSGLQKVARMYGYKGKIDNIWGSGSAAGFAQFLRVNWGYKGNDVLGPNMWAAIARWLRTRWSYKGNDVVGPVMRAALKRAEEANYREL